MDAIPDSLANNAMGPQRNVERMRPRTWRQLAGQQGRVDEDDDDRQWPSWLMILGLFTMLVAFWWTSAVVLVTYWTVGRLFCALAFGGNLLYGPWVQRLLGMGRGYWFMFNLLFIGPVLFTLFFGLNGLVTHDTRPYILRGLADPRLKAYWIEHGTLPPYALAEPGDTVVVTDRFPIENGHIRVLRLSRGLFGFEVMAMGEPVYVVR